MAAIRIIGRGSRLSLLQMEKVKEIIVRAFPSLTVEIIVRNSRGDALQDIPLHTVEGSDFFTQDIFDALAAGEADIAVHSLKDMSSDHFFGGNRFAVVDRDDMRDIVLLRNDVDKKIKAGETIFIGTCSPRREEMAIGFLQQALPQWNKNFRITTKNIRGNVDTRLRKLDAGEYDGIILATAGLNRLLRSDKDATGIQKLLKDKRKVFLPLIECVPAPCQGAIVAEAHPSNALAIEVLNRINKPNLLNDCIAEKKLAVQYGIGCLQRFGVASLSFTDQPVLYAAGRNAVGENFSNWTGLPEPAVEGRNFFSSTDFMGSFFDYNYNKETVTIKEPVVYVANYKAVEQPEVIEQLNSKRIWASGSRTWLELARKGVWVEGCADAFGLEFLDNVWPMPLVNIRKEDIRIVTNEEASEGWQAKGWKTNTTYSLQKNIKKELSDLISEADIVFWTSFQQYKLYKNFLKADVQHICPTGETAFQFHKQGLSPLVFPNIKAFQQWRKSYTR